MNDSGRLYDLLEGYAANRLSIEELEELKNLLNDSSVESRAGVWLMQQLEQTPERQGYSEERLQAVLKAIHAKKAQKTNMFFMNRNWWAAAASVIILLVGGLYLIKNNNKTTNQSTQIAQAPKNDVKAPVTNKAVITLANGQQIILDSAGNGTLAQQGDVNIIKKEDGEIAYSGSPASAGATQVAFNTLTNPKGSKVVSLILSDGSKVWLNAESSLTYPTVFTGKERKVEITGEAYFEVKHDPSQPFIVSKGEVQVQVLGTHFNVNTYSDEKVIKVTLLEGSVKVTNGTGHMMIRPGEQAQVPLSGGIIVDGSVDIDGVVAWKNGYFNFDREPITSIMNQLSRWYDADVVYEGPKPEDLFSGIINRDNNVSQVLKLLEQTNRVHFRIEDHKVIVTR